MTLPQRKIWTFLQDDENRALTPSQLTQNIGYASASSWYQALKDEAFRHMLESLGVVVFREHHDPEVRGLVPLAENPAAEWEKEIVDVRRLVPDYPKHIAASALKLNFSFLCNHALKAVVKRYFRARLGFWEPSSLSSYLRWLKPFLWNLDNRYPGLASFAAVTREMIEPVLTASWIDERGRRHSISAFKRRHMLIATELDFVHFLSGTGSISKPRKSRTGQ